MGNIVDIAGKPIESGNAQAQVQPVKKGANRIRGLYLLMPKGMADQLEQAHVFLASIERAPESFEQFLRVLIMQGANVFIPHQMAEYEAEQVLMKRAEVQWATEILGKPDTETTEADRVKAHDILAGAEMDRAAEEQKRQEEERPPREIELDPQGAAAREAVIEAEAQRRVQAALDEADAQDAEDH